MTYRKKMDIEVVFRGNFILVNAKGLSSQVSVKKKL